MYFIKYETLEGKVYVLGPIQPDDPKEGLADPSIELKVKRIARNFEKTFNDLKYCCCSTDG